MSLHGKLAEFGKTPTVFLDWGNEWRAFFATHLWMNVFMSSYPQATERSTYIYELSTANAALLRIMTNKKFLPSVRILHSVLVSRWLGRV